MTDRDEQLVISDFDGTITIKDVNDALFDEFGDRKNELIEKRYQKDLLGHREALEQHYSRLEMSRDDFETFVIENIDLDPYFAEFYSFINDQGLEFAIVSGGFLNYIRLLFKREKIEMKHPVYANEILFTDGFYKLNFYHDLDSCPVGLNTCGNCKHKLLENFKQKYKEIIYIGDGWTDRCAAQLADRLLVKEESSLEAYCQREHLDYELFSTFQDILAWFKKLQD